MTREHGFYWIKHPDHPDYELVAQWCHLQAAGCEVWFLPGDEDYRFDEQVMVISDRQNEPSGVRRNAVYC